MHINGNLLVQNNWKINIEFCFMQRDLILTKDGSHTIAVTGMPGSVTYHSIHGAIQESMHVFIEAGLNSVRPLEATRGLNIFEIGFGTGLNALLTYIEAEKTKQIIHYAAVDLYPLEENEITTLNYCKQLERQDLFHIFLQMHSCEWERDTQLSETFYLHKTKQDLQDYKNSGFYDLIYFDAFAPNIQPELWTKNIFEKIYSILNTNGILVTYCSKGDVRRNMMAAGFIVEKMEGPPGKREMIRARKMITDR
jgi:tRNA U34 5-methylaminomethyl-2-thiouridine-forming methyltransferase MnmC